MAADLRWDGLFDDLAGQFDALAGADFDDEVRERTLAELGRIALAARLRAVEGGTIVLGVRGAGRVTGTLRRAGPDWLLLGDASGGEAIVALAAVLHVGGTGDRAVPFRPGEPAARLGLAPALRGMARRRLPVLVTLVDGEVRRGRLMRVGADHVDVVPSGRSGGAGVTVPFPALAVVRAP